MTPLHIHPAPILVFLQQGKLKHSRGETINFFSAGESFIESDSGSPYLFESVDKKPAFFLSVCHLLLVYLQQLINS